MFIIYSISLSSHTKFLFYVYFMLTVAPGGNNLATICYKDFLGLATINMYYYYYYYYYTFCLSLQPLLELGSKSTFLSSGLWMLPKKCDTICRYIACSQILFCPFYLLLQPLLELGSKSTSLSSGFSDVIKAGRYDLLIHCLIS